MQRMMQTLLERRGLAVWVEDRMLRLMRDGATVHMARGYADYAHGQEPNYVSVVGSPFAAEHYHEGYGLAAYELGDLTMRTGEEQELAA